MDKCIYNGRIVNSFDIAANLDIEMEIRQSKELYCCDPECNAPVRYRHGKIRIPHFAHLMGNTECDYEKYSSKKSDIFQRVQQEVYDVLKMKYSSAADIDVKLIRSPAHYTPIVLNSAKSNLAIDITDKRITANTLQFRKETYSDLGYYGIQIIIDEASDCELSESSDLYLPVRYEINKSENNSAVVYNKSSRKYYYLRYENNPKYKHFYYNDVFSREFNINEIDFTEKGLSVPRLDIEFEKWVAQREKEYNEHIESLRKAEEQRKQAAEKREEKFAELAAAQKNEQTNDKPVKKAKPPFDPIAFHKETGKYSGTVLNGVRETLELDEIKIKKGVPNYYKVYSEKEMEDLINKAFSYQISDIRQMLNKMYHANRDEKAVFIRIYEEYLNAEQTEDVVEKLKILEYAIIEAEIFE